MGSENTSWVHLLGWDQMHHDARDITNMFWQLSDWILWGFMFSTKPQQLNPSFAIGGPEYAFQFNTLVSSFISAKKVKSTSFYNTQRGKDCFGISCCSSQRFPGFGAPSHMAWILHIEYHVLYIIYFVFVWNLIYYKNVIYSSLSYGLDIIYHTFTWNIK